MKKLLYSDWLRAVQFKCNTSAKSVTQGQMITHRKQLFGWIMIEKENENLVDR